MSTNEKVRENRLRRSAARQGLTLTRSRRRDPRAVDFGRYWLASSDGEIQCDPEGLTIDQVEERLLGTPEE
ncbi:hypothetical protein [Micromonospora chalcea]|uniref:hypothetical protein n=1 Tax=Micromonospora chalcea TaxID=1874 RepID=UPI003D7551BB